ncbi:MAG: pantetheine-phosphate adenylyltransferase [Erysipelotrichaceae bacterium]|nr:pantetheine-phosphate adenylyltransferase [Erysipelotrichaceae bacterium]
MSKAMFPGTFDPITIGHVDIIERASKCFDEVVVAIMVNPRKTPTFTVEHRIEMIRKCTSHLKNVTVTSSDGLTIQFAKKIGATVLIRGVRTVADYEYEMAQATANMQLDDSIETMMLTSRPQYSYLSSSMAKEIAMNNGDISSIIPAPIIQEVQEAFS